MKNPKKITRLILKYIQGGPRPSGLTTDQISLAREALGCLTNFHSSILRLHYGSGYSIQKIAAYYKSPHELVKLAHLIALDAFEKELWRAGLFNAPQQPPPKVRSYSSSDRDSGARFSCPQCNAKLEKPKNPSMLFFICCGACGAAFPIPSDAGDVLSMGSVNVPSQTIDEPEKNLTLADSFELLGVSPFMSLPVIRQAYLMKIQQYHPDKVAHLGPEFMPIAEKMSKRINSAWALIQSSHSMPTS